MCMLSSTSCTDNVEELVIRCSRRSAGCLWRRARRLRMKWGAGTQILVYRTKCLRCAVAALMHRLPREPTRPSPQNHETSM